MNRATPRVLLLDADGVTQLPAPTWRTSLEALCPDPERTEDFLADVFAAEKPCLAGSADFEASLAEVLARWRIEVSLAEALRIWAQITPAADVLAMVPSLRAAGTAVALATNQQAYRATFMATQLEYASLFDHLLFSCELGCAKPSAEYFSAALANVSCEPGEALFIDDHASNIEAARGCGLNAELFHVSEGADRLREILCSHGLMPA